MPIASSVVDFACLKTRLVVEIDGGQHNLDSHTAADRSRDEKLTSLGFRVVRFWNSDVDRNIEGVVEAIVLASQAIPTPGASRRTLPYGEG